ncbi:MAG TPA: tyrosine-type recombinase/integrase [Euzebya sp.]|nr:tyrosine-type recombinase/integrase [Euzebya sp.]
MADPSMGVARLALVGAAGVEEALLEEMLGGWRRQQQARRLSASIIAGRERVVRRFAEFSQAWPWSWREGQLEGWVAGNAWAHSTVRSYQGAIGCFLAYAIDPRNGWVAECQQRVGAVPRQICHEWNTAVHVADYEGRPGRRPLSRSELQRLFDTIDDAVGAAAGSGRKGWLAAFRDAVLFKTIYGWGLRRTEAVMLDVTDFTANPAAPRLGGLGVCHVRHGKAQRGSAPRRRAVASVWPWAVEALGQYLTEVRAGYRAAAADQAVWLTERGGRISATQVDARFGLWRDRAGLDRALSVHCLRHSYVSHLTEDGVDPLFVQQQVGHSWASTTAIYTTVGADAKQRMLAAALAHAFDADVGWEQP